MMTAMVLKAQNFIAVVEINNTTQAYIDTVGNIIINVSKENDGLLFPFKGNYGRVKKMGYYYFVDVKGNQVNSGLFEKAEDFNGGLAEVRLNNKWGFINQQGEVVIIPQYFDSHKFCCGLSVMSKGGKHGYINAKNEIIIKPQFDRVSHFADNKAFVLNNGYWGCINKEGNYIIESKYTDTQNFSEGYAWVKKDGIWGLIDSLGKYVIEPNEHNPLLYAHSASFKQFAKFHNGLMISKAYDKIGYCNYEIKKVIPSKFDKASDFMNGKACVKINKYWGIIDITGKYIVEPIYKELKLSDNQLYPAKHTNGLWGFINKKNEWVIKPVYVNADGFKLVN